MEKYLVGGAVRDFLLNLPVTERDWVITGSSPKEMLNIGYEQVGKGFPVFLHPETHEEYALARTEIKLGQGYDGFVCYAEPSVTIEEDLYRRDLTINAMAYDIHGNLLDPYDGQRDIKLRLLRHVSAAFYEDPLRVLRVARFAARFKSMGFTIAPETLQLMMNMVRELNTLSIERVWMETKKALSTDNPQIYFQVLRQCGGLKILFPELDILFSIFNFKQRYLFNNISLGDYVLKKLYSIACLTPDLSIRFSVLCSHLREVAYSLTKSSDRLNDFVNELCNRLKVPYNFRKLARIVSVYCKYLFNVTVLSPHVIITIFNAFNCWRHPKCLDQIIFINKSNLLMNQDNMHFLYIQEKFLRTAFSIVMRIKVNDVIKDGFVGSDISKELYNRRLCNLIIWNKTYALSNTID